MNLRSTVRLCLANHKDVTKQTPFKGALFPTRHIKTSAFYGLCVRKIHFDHVLTSAFTISYIKMSVLFIFVSVFLNISCNPIYVC